MARISHRLRRHWELREFDGLHFALQTGDAAETADAIRKFPCGPLIHHAHHAASY